jgi:hypothetical protein
MNKYRKTTKKLDATKHNKKTRKYRKQGGTGTAKTYTPYTFDPISNGEILAFLLIDLIAETQTNYFHQLIDKNVEFINSIQVVNSGNNNDTATIIAKY